MDPIYLMTRPTIIILQLQDCCQLGLKLANGWLTLNLRQIPALWEKCETSNLVRFQEFLNETLEISQKI